MAAKSSKSIGLTVGALALGGVAVYLLTRKAGRATPVLPYGVSTANMPQIQPYQPAAGRVALPPRKGIVPIKGRKRKPATTPPAATPRKPIETPGRLYEGFYTDLDGNKRYAKGGKTILEPGIMVPAVEPAVDLPRIYRIGLSTLPPHHQKKAKITLKTSAMRTIPARTSPIRTGFTVRATNAKMHPLRASQAMRPNGVRLAPAPSRRGAMPVRLRSQAGYPALSQGRMPKTVATMDERMRSATPYRPARVMPTHRFGKQLATRARYGMKMNRGWHRIHRDAWQRRGFARLRGMRPRPPHMQPSVMGLEGSCLNNFFRRVSPKIKLAASRRIVKARRPVHSSPVSRALFLARKRLNAQIAAKQRKAPRVRVIRKVRTYSNPSWGRVPRRWRTVRRIAHPRLWMHRMNAI